MTCRQRHDLASPGDQGGIGIDNPRAKALLIHLIKQVFEFTFSTANDGSHHCDTLTGPELQDSLDDLVGGLAGDGTATIGAVGSAYRGVEATEDSRRSR